MKRLIVAAVVLASLLLGVMGVSADQEFNLGSSLSGGNFKILDPQHGGFGGTSSSSSSTFRLLGTIGDLSIGLSSTSMFGLRSGFEYFPFIQEPDLLSAVPGSGKVTLTWSAAQAGAGLTVGGYNVCTKPPAGSFTCQNVGLVLNFVKTGLTNGTNYTFKIQAKDALGNLIAESNQLSATPSGGGGGGGGGGSIPTPTPSGGGGASVELTGLAYPGALVHVLRDGAEIATTVADSHGVFVINRSGMTSGVANLGFWAVDTDGRRSVTWVFAVTLVDGQPNRVGGIIVPPTISLSDNEVPLGQPVTVRGQSAPGATVRIDFSGRQSTVIAGPVGDGRYSTILSTTGLPAAVYEVKSRTELLPSGNMSTWSQLLQLAVGVPLPAGTCPRDPDINRDGDINLVDFSILAFWWQKSVGPNAPYDLNCDGRVTLADFSIEAFYWTGR